MRPCRKNVVFSMVFVRVLSGKFYPLWPEIKSTPTGVLFISAYEQSWAFCTSGYETDERSSLGEQAERRRWRKKRGKRVAAVEKRKRAARRVFRAPQQAHSDNPKVVGSNPASATKKDSIVDTISAMEFCFICLKRLIFALLPLTSAVLRAFFLLKR